MRVNIHFGKNLHGCGGGGVARYRSAVHLAPLAFLALAIGSCVVINHLLLPILNNSPYSSSDRHC